MKCQCNYIYKKCNYISFMAEINAFKVNVFTYSCREPGAILRLFCNNTLATDKKVQNFMQHRKKYHIRQEQLWESGWWDWL